MDPVVIAQDGVQKFKADNFEIIIVDTRYMVNCWMCVGFIDDCLVVVTNRLSHYLKKCFKFLMQW